ncbi:hypothetical protein [Saccharopolyspora sp. NPDC002686]|uniref:hypothetical protein n=1 Tax=Saccharopolyspora sp. NPDC002686 TaxID=3154541 RepID=UPI0033215E95
MPLRWGRGENPYRENYFGILQVGSHASPLLITSRRRDLQRKIGAGGEHRVAGRTITEAELAEAESRLLDPARRAAEALLVHARPATHTGRLPELCAAVEEAATVEESSRPLQLTNLAALAPLVPPPHPADLPRPSWADLPVPAPDSPEDTRADVLFDL